MEKKINKKNIIIKNDDTSNVKKSIVDIPDLLKANFRHSKSIGNFNKLILPKKSFKNKKNNKKKYDEKENGNLKKTPKKISSLKKKKYKDDEDISKNNKKEKNKDKLKVRFQSNKDIIKDLSLDDEFKKVDSLKELTLSQKKNDNTHHTHYNKNYLNVSNGIILEESFVKSDNDSEESHLKINNNKNNNENNKISFNMEQKSENKLSLSKYNDKLSRKSCHSSNELNIIQIPEQKKESTNSEGEFDFNTEDLEELSRIINQNNNELFHSKCKDLNILEDAFNEQFYNIINNELDYFKNNINKFKLNNQERI